MDLFTCSACGGRVERSPQLGMGVCQECGQVKRYVFISYSTKNQQMADAFLHTFLERGIPVWMAPNDIPVGEEYAGVITDALENCACLVLLLTNAAQESQWVRREVEAIISLNKPILPVQLEEVELNRQFRFFLKTNQILPLPDLDTDSPRFQQLLGTLETLMGGPVAAPKPAAEEPAKAPPPQPTPQASPEIKKPGWLEYLRNPKILAGCALALLCLVLLFTLPEKDADPVETDPDQLQTVPTSPETTTPEAAITVLSNIWANYTEDELFPAVGGNTEAGVLDAPGAWDMAYAENLTYDLLVPRNQLANISEAACLHHLQHNSIFTCGAFTLADGVDAGAFADTMRQAVHGHVWLFGSPENLMIALAGNNVVMAFGTEDLTVPFLAHLTEAYPQAKILYNEPIADQ